MSLLSWLSGASGEARRALADYADDGFLHVAAAGALSPERRREELAAFTPSLDRRIARLRSFTSTQGTTLPAPDGDRSRVEPIAQALDAFIKSRLSGLTEIEPALAMDWRARTPQGLERQVRTLAIDLGAYCGEVGIRCAPRYAWVTDETRYTPATIMPTAGRVVIGHDPAKAPSPMQNHVDAIDAAAFALSQIVHFRTVKAKGLWRPNYFHFLSSLADGLLV